MPEPISMCAGALGVIANAIDLSIRTYTLIEGIKSCPENVKRLAVELRGVSKVLAMLSHTLDAQSRKSRTENIPVHFIANTRELIENCIEIFEEVEKCVKPFAEADASVLRSFRTGFKWEVGKKGTVTTLQRQLSNQKATLELAISTLNFFNSSQIVDMVADLQKDVQRVRKQMNQRDQRERQSSKTNASQQLADQQDAHSIPMQRFLERTASVASRVSVSTVSTEITDLDSIFSDNISITTDKTFVGVEVPVQPAKDVYQHETAKAPMGLDQVEAEVTEDPNMSVNSLPRPARKSTWQKLRSGMRRSSSGNSNALESVPETAAQATPHSTQPLPISEHSSERPLGPPSPQENQFEVRATPVGAPLVKSVSSPSIPSYESEHQRDSGPNLDRSRTDPIMTLSDLSIRQNEDDNPPPGTRWPPSGYSNINGNAPPPQFSEPQQRSNNPYFSSGYSDFGQSPTASPQSLSTQTHSPSNNPDPATPCTKCKSPLSTHPSLTLSSSPYHTACFRCSNCRILFPSASPPPKGPFCLSADYLVCNSCAFICQVCDEGVDEHGPRNADYGGIAVEKPCQGLFFCHKCLVSIRGTRFVRNRRGVFCLGCL
ncbi:hypothetical protein BCR34DRAFT_393152 [Clohesyomyces aquaticus]|uniref:LIM zinc-binding domain-containing protein n=1 Tax=Clohesyomyces aquaticus TaxID=1231657 RepID=A0A1Y1ZEX7_9PLEO|nr:hypothetical protein BCR34DRAFT_393152 [Clohesyomyces aquaticus]